MATSKLTKYTTLVISQRDQNIFTAIKSGKKTIETRPHSRKYRGLRAGDGLRFVCAGGVHLATIKDVRIYHSIDELAKKEELTAIFPGAHTVEEFKRAYKNIPGLLRRIEENGIVAFELDG